MRIVLDVTASADNHIEGTASWANGGQPVHFTGWLDLMRLFEDANDGVDNNGVDNNRVDNNAANHRRRGVVDDRAGDLPASASGPGFVGQVGEQQFDL
jgi:hypothetical protein